MTGRGVALLAGAGRAVRGSGARGPGASARTLGAAKRSVATVLLACVALALTACAPARIATVPPEDGDERVSVRLLAFNDFHGQLEPGGLTLRLRDGTGALRSHSVGGAAFRTS